MGQLAVAAGGALVGNVIPGVGGAVGWIVGSIVGSLLFPAGQDVKGPRVQDLKVTSSTFGAPIPRGYGTNRLAGNVTWIKGGQIEEIKDTRRVGKGGGPKATEFSYFGTFAVDFGEGPAEDVLRIWADSKLIYDKRGANDNVNMEGLAFRFYPGTEDQLPDSLEEADKGVGEVPAYRGHVRLVFDHLPLHNFGNRLPNITAEIAYTKTDSLPVELATARDTPLATFTNAFTAVDWERGYAYAIDTSPFEDITATGLRRVNLYTMLEDRQITSEDALDQLTPDGDSVFRGPMCVLPSGRVVVQLETATGTNANPIAVLHADTMTEQGRFGEGSNNLDYDLDSWGNSKSCVPVALYGPQGREEYVLFRTIGANEFGVLFIPLEGDPIFLWSASELLSLAITLGSIRGVCPGKIAEGFGDGYMVDGNSYAAPSSDSVRLWRVRLSAGATYSLVGAQNVTTGVDVEIMATLTPADLIPGETDLQNAGQGLVYDQTDDTVMFHVRADSDSQNYIVKVNPRTGDVVWRAPVSSAPNDGSEWSQSRIQNNRFGFFAAPRDGTLIDTRTGEVLADDQAYVGFTVATGAPGAFDSRRNAWVGLTDDDATVWFKAYFERVTGEPALVSDIVTDLCDAVGLDASDIVVTDLTNDEVPGYVVSRQSSARDAIQPLAQTFFFDGVESDFLLKFKQRGSASVRTITQDELARLDERTGEFLRENRVQEVELPERLVTVYLDADNDYNEGAQSAKRILGPTNAMFSHNEQSLEFPGALQATFAKQATEVALYSAWIERVSFNKRLAWTHLDLDPADVVTLTLDSGASFRVRLFQADVGDSLSIDVTSLQEEDDQYASTVAADKGDGPLGQEVPADTVTKTLIIDSPLLRDAHEPAGRAFVQMYTFMGGYGQTGWHSGTLFKSSDSAASYAEVARIVSEMTWGSTLNALGDPPDDNPFATDEVNTLTISITSETEDVIESVTEAEMLAGANAAMLIKANGEVEVFQFQNVTDNGDGTLTLDTLLRGRRGTDTMCFGHGAGEVFLLLDANDGDVFSLTLAEVGATRYYKGVGASQLFEDADILVNVSQGRALMPYAPVQIEAALAMGNDIDLTWVRRSRITPNDITGEIPLNEDTEEYELEIFDAPGGTVVRTVTGLTTPDYTYTSADQTTDGFTPPLAELTVKVYQVSAQVGRGFARETTVEVV